MLLSLRHCMVDYAGKLLATAHVINADGKKGKWWQMFEVNTECEQILSDRKWEML